MSTPQIPPEIACRTCQMAGCSITSRAVDLKCADCCVRHLMRMIEDMAKFGGEGHARRIGDLLAKKLIDEA